jgi:hypothetical protein
MRKTNKLLSAQLLWNSKLDKCQLLTIYGLPPSPGISRGQVWKRELHTGVGLGHLELRRRQIPRLHPDPLQIQEQLRKSLQAPGRNIYQVERSGNKVVLNKKVECNVLIARQFIDCITRSGSW